MRLQSPFSVGKEKEVDDLYIVMFLLFEITHNFRLSSTTFSLSFDKC